MSFYRWAMRKGAAILFVASLLIFVTGFVAQLLAPTGSYSWFGGDITPALPRLMFFLAAITNAISVSALTFFAACLLHRADLALAARQAAK